MTVGAGISVNDGRLNVSGKSILSDVHNNIIVTPASGESLIVGAFIDVRSDEIGSRMVFPVGKLREMKTMNWRFAWKVVILPCKNLMVRSHLVFIAAGSIPFDVITNAVKAVERHLQTFSHRDRKKMPDMLNWFGWCTWDAFYTDVTAAGVEQSLKSFESGGISPKFIIVDDGWQSVGMDLTSTETKADDSANFANRLIYIKENHKFQKNGEDGLRVEDPSMGIQHIVSQIKDKHSVKYVYVWHAITGYWGGVKPGIAEM